MELTNELYSAVNRYFNTLSKTGYKSYNSVNKLLIAFFIEELLYGPLAMYITERDYKKITNALYCLYGDCALPYRTYNRVFTPVINKMADKYRISEMGILRSLETSLLRIES